MHAGLVEMHAAVFTNISEKYITSSVTVTKYSNYNIHLVKHVFLHEKNIIGIVRFSFLVSSLVNFRFDYSIVFTLVSAPRFPSRDIFGAISAIHSIFQVKRPIATCEQAQLCGMCF